MRPKFQIGDVVWRAATAHRPIRYQCLECAGHGFITVVLGDETKLTIACECCKRGYDGSNGYHDQCEHYESVEMGVVSGVEIDGDSFEYRVPTGTNDYWCMKETDLFSDEESAKVRANELSVERTHKQAELHCKKYNANRSWAWNVKYHREAIRRMERDIAYHTLQLNYAKTKEPKE